MPPRTCGLLIDDQEDGSGRICEGVEGRRGAWYVFNDDAGMQWPLKTVPGVPIATSANDGRGGESRRAMHTFGSGFTKWGSGIGFDLHFDGTRYQTYDARAYAGIGFWMRSSEVQRLRLRVSSAYSTAPEYGGTCTETSCAGPPGVALQATPRWRYYEVGFDELAIPDSRLRVELDRLTNVQFMPELRGETFDYWVDDVTFLEQPPSCCPSLPACKGGVHLTDPLLESAILSQRQLPSLSCENACTLRHLYVNGYSVQSLGGMECLTNLENVAMGGNQIQDLSPLAGLVELTSLWAASNRLDRVDLHKLENLRSLDLNDNVLQEVILASAARPLRVALRGNRLADIRSLSGLRMGVFPCETCAHSLSELDLSSNLLTDLSPLLTMTLERTVVDVRDNPLDCAAQLQVIQTLRGRGATVMTDCG